MVLKAGLVLFVWAAFGFAQAQVCSSSVDVEKWTASNADEARRCLDRTQQVSIAECAKWDRPVCKALDEWRKPAPEGADQAVQSAVKWGKGLPKILLDVSDNLSAKAAAAPGSPELRADLGAWAAEVDKKIVSDRITASRDLRAHGAQFWKVRDLRLFPGTAKEVAIDSGIDRACNKTRDDCTAALRAAAEVGFAAQLAYSASTVLISPDLSKVTDYVNQMVKRWDVYFEDARYQWPWELAINSALFERNYSQRGILSPPHGTMDPVTSGRSTEVQPGRCVKIDHRCVDGASRRKVSMVMGRRKGDEHVRRRFGLWASQRWKEAQFGRSGGTSSEEHDDRRHARRLRYRQEDMASRYGRCDEIVSR